MKYIFTFLISIATINGISQIVLTQQNNALTIGEEYTITVCNNSGIDEGPSGANKTWDFSALQPNGQGSYNYEIVDASNTPYASSFLNASIAIKDNTNGHYVYYDYTANQATEYGFANQSMVSFYSNPLIYLEYPYTYNSSHNDEFYTHYTMSGYDYYRNGNVSCVADAYGTVILPHGTFNNTLRIKMTQTIIDSSDFSVNTTVLTTYLWYSETSHYPILTVNHSQSSDMTTTSVYYSVNGTSAINTISNQEYVVYPTPCKSDLYIEKPIVDNSFYEVKIYDLLGKCVFTKTCIERKKTIKISVSELLSGMYIAQIINNKNEVIFTKPIIKD